ncbi:MAG: response regulator [Clostridiales bacterium]|jgi:two-component system response regulator YesN|nr:response regulator [Clostridiales bacterium]
MLKVILADDEESIRRALLRLVDWSALGYEVIGVFEDGKDVIASPLLPEADLVLSDIRMFELGGLDVARYIYEHKLHPRVCLFSGYQDFAYAREALQLGVCGYILKPIAPQELRNTLSKIHDELLGFPRSGEGRDSSGGEWVLLPQIRSFIQQNLSASLSLKTIAEAFSFNPSYFSRRFKAETGMTVGAYLLKIRMERAAALLKEGRTNRQIADAIGFSSEKYFCRCFKQWAGCTTGEFKRMKTRKEEAK